MGVFKPSGSAGQYEYWGTMTAYIEATNTPTDKTWGTITLPATLPGEIKSAYIDVFWNMAYNATAATTATFAANTVVVDNTAAGGNVTASTITSGAHILGPQLYYGGNFCLIGDTDISAKVEAGTTLTVKSLQLETVGTSSEKYKAYGVICRLRIITG